MNDTRTQQEPSMEEILASIRRIISEDGEPESRSSAPPPPPPPPSAVDEDVLELTQMVRDDGSVVPVEADPWDHQTVEEPEMDVHVEPSYGHAAAVEADEDDLVSPPTAHAASAAFSMLAENLSSGRSRGPATHGGGPTIEDIVRDMLRPMLREWLDGNLQPLVEDLVQREIEKMVRRSRGS
jgi:cell pole-organizing protein PopZ